jgi:hypothetical protein
MLLVFGASSASLIPLERREPDAPFDMPVWLPWLTLALCGALVVARLFVGGGGH